MAIGLVRFRLHFPGAGSLKSKRKILLSLKDRIRNRFNVSVAELEDNDLWQKCTLGVAIIANDRNFANSVLSKIIDLVNSRPEMVVTNIDMEWF
ncbi:MAG: DUF503 domain-containing protein [Candidatus Zixiibacteriota bacterium]|nr:MAG: DUF503 domain-containing protein [candidate division Zixibacteria bacterium]